jgi:hypothetical protein
MFVYFDGKLQRESFRSITTCHGGEARVWAMGKVNKVVFTKIWWVDIMMLGMQ